MYKTLYLKENPDFEYQKRGKNWFKRKKGSKTDFYAVNENCQIVLNKNSNKLDIVSDSYYNQGFTTFSLTIKSAISFD